MANTYVKINSVTVGGGGAANIDFASIPSTYTDLLLVMSARVTSTGGDSIMTLNNITATAGYTNRPLFGDGSATGSFTTAPDARYFLAGWYTPSGATANTFSNTQIYISNYTAAINKSISIESVTENNTTSVVTSLVTGLFSNTAAINRITLSSIGNFTQYSTATLYGISKT
jgi:hypothetical protein